MPVTVSITEDNLFKALGEFIKGLVDCPVVRSQVNRVAMPAGDVIEMTTVLMPALSTPVESYTDEGDIHTRNLTRSTQWTAQIDCYGDGAGNRATALSVAFRSDYACEQFAATGLQIQPLYATDPNQLPLTTAENQYLERWTFETVFQFNPTICLPQQFADALVIGLINVDATYPPGA
jgi:hypothetical protein